MTSSPSRLRPVVALLLGLALPRPAASQATQAPLTPDAWVAAGRLQTVEYLGRHALFLDRGAALLKDAAMPDGTLELDLAASDSTNFLGVMFRAASLKAANVIFLRPGSSGNEEAIQYGPALNTLGVAWQVYHYDGANAVANVPRKAWIHLRLELAGPAARLYLDTATTPVLVVPRVVSTGGSGIGIWDGPFGRGSYFSNIRFTPTATAAPVPEPPAPPRGTIRDWELSDAIEAADFTPERLPDLRRRTWQRVTTEPEGFVLVNRYREAPVGGVPRDSSGAVLGDSVMTGRVAGERVVYARTTIMAARAGMRRLEFSYNNGVVIYLNGRPLFFAMNPGGFRTPLGVMAHQGDALYLPLRAGRNELVFAVMDLTGGWAYSARLDPPAPAGARR